jgi:sigma-B regulation protein RsbU (phosphoserine phosphatase)
MTAKREFSIKYKLLILLAALPVVTLAVYLLLAVRLFESDKIAYVYDSSAAVSRALAQRTDIELESFIHSLRPVLKGFQPTTQQFSSAAALFFNAEPQLKAVYVFRKNSLGDSASPARLEKSNFKLEPSVWSVLVKKACAEGVWFEAGKTDREIIDGRFYIATCEDRIPVVAVGEAPDFRKSFEQSSVYTLSLMNSSGAELIAPPHSAPLEISQWVFLPELMKSKLREHTAEVNNGAGTAIVSVTRVGFGNLLVVSLIPKSTALSAVNVLLWKSFLALIALLSLAIMISVFASHRLTSSLIELTEASEKVGEGKFDIRVKVRSNDEVGSLATRFNQMAGEVSRLMTENIQKARMEKELETAKLVQETLFPLPNAKIKSIELSGFYEPASECGGDWWHYSEIGGKIFLWIGDVTGHGAPAALITSAAKSATTLIEGMPEMKVSQVMGLLNQAVYQTSGGRLNMTFFLAAFDPATRVLSYCNASHEPPFWIRKTGATWSKKDFLLLDETNNPRLGENAVHRFQQSECKLAPGDRLLFYTDGVVDLMSQNQEAWGERNFLKAIMAGLNESEPTKNCVATIQKMASHYRDGASLHDDVTFFMCNILSSEEGNA